MAYTIPPALRAIIADADNVAPGRSHASDGTIGDARHQQQGSKSDHNPDERGVVHAVDITHDPAHGMDAWFWAQLIAARMLAGEETRVEYLVSNDGKGDVIFHPSVSTSWRRQTSTGNEHANHLHTSIKRTLSAEADARPYFVTAHPPVPPPTPHEELFMRSRYYPPQSQTHTFWIGTDYTRPDGTKVKRNGRLLHSWRTRGSDRQEFEDLSAKLGLNEFLVPERGLDVFIDEATLELVVTGIAIDGALIRVSWAGTAGPWKIAQPLPGR